MTATWYRFQEYHYAPTYDYTRDCTGYGSGRTEVVLHDYRVVRHTPNDYGHDRWVSKTTRKRFAYPTKEASMVSFRARKKRQIKILKAQTRRAERALAAAGRLPEFQPADTLVDHVTSPS